MNKEVKEEELFIPKTKHKGLKILLAIILISGLIVGGYFLYQYKFNNPKTIISNALEKAKNNIKESFQEIANTDKYQFDGHIKLNTNIDDEIFKILKDIELQINGEIDSTESNANYTINTKYKDDKLIDIKAYQEKSTIYILLEEIYDKYLKIDSKIDESKIKEALPIDTINPKDIQTIYNALIYALEKEILKIDIKSEDATITIDGKDVQVINNYIELKDKEVNNLAKNILNNLKNNQDFITIMNNLTKEKTNEIFDEIEAGINQEEFQGIYRINLYTNKSILNKELVSIRQTISQNGLNVLINVDVIDKNEYSLSISTMGISYVIKVKNNNSAINLTLEMNALGQYINIELNMNYKKINTINKPDVSNNKDINDLDEKEIEEIEKKIMSNKNLLKLIENIENINKKEA